MKKSINKNLIIIFNKNMVDINMMSLMWFVLKSSSFYNEYGGGLKFIGGSKR